MALKALMLRRKIDDKQKELAELRAASEALKTRETELERAIARLVGIEQLDAAEPVLATERQRDCAVRALGCVREGREALALGLALDAVSVSVDGAIAAILELTGERATEAVVNDVFARFCVGK